MDTEDQAAKEQDRKLYEAQCLKYQDGAHAAIQEFDKAILTLSAGALGLSLSFIKDIVPLRQAVSLPLLYWSWYLFGCSVLLTLISFIASQKAFKHAQRTAYRYYILQEHQVFEQKSVPGLMTRYLTYAAGGCFVLALMLTLGFTTKNLNNASAILQLNQPVNGGRMPEQPAPHVGTVQEPLQKGVEPAGLIRVPAPQPLIVPAAPVQQTPTPTQSEKK
jgi:hypothetical protein